MPFLVQGIFCPLFLEEGLFLWIARRLIINIQSFLAKARNNGTKVQL